MPKLVDTTSAVAAAGVARALRPARPPLRRPRECAISGVSAGLAAHLRWNVTVVRILFILTALLWGAGILFYLWLWAFVPWADRTGEGDAAPTHRVPVAWILAAASIVCLLFALTVVSSYQSSPFPASPRLVLGVTVLTVGLASIAGLWATLVDRADPARGPRHEIAVRITVTAVLVAFLLILLTTLGRGGVASFFVALIPLVGLAAVYASSVVDRMRELSRERVRRIKEEQRSEMAAHLHDSVLQTLALIQTRAGASSEAARLARAQERELRAWLYDGDAPADSDLPTDLRDYAAALELDYPVRMDVVSAGESPERASGEVAAAAREAMLNAARHAPGDVSVYIEGTASVVDVFVRDRGAGFNPDTVPGDRLGVRESIIGRMRRAGGSATVKSTPSGTEVHLRLAREATRA
ncbi:PspC domain-containing protein [Microbacterium sp. ASV49]|uniref:PspC domain-containing protein n=1 Tax=Microbacterium candidum TaxID=3041922 RepID=A0ABT7MX54_9MICO|nr:PspC domain-containing protein [Microbacterium sp. ASV49]MDL9979031.1 PspC domain-containing protein [Microbacterium sp. ASV49]